MANMKEEVHHHHHDEPQTNKYEQALSKYKFDIKDEDVKEAVKKIIAEKVHENDTLEVKKFLMGSVELTTLKTTDSEESVLAFTEKVNQFSNAYPDLPHVATICVYPCFADIVNTEFVIEGIAFSIQYPIDIKKLNHGGFQVTYNTDVESPLELLTTNQVENEFITPENGNTFLLLTVPAQQFWIKTVETTITSIKAFNNTNNISNFVVFPTNTQNNNGIL
jgi:hypothetical protein